MSEKIKMSQHNLPKPISGAGLTAAGIVILQSIIILLCEVAEYRISKVGTATGISILISVLGALYLGRKGTAWISVVTPPIVFALISIFLIILKTKFHISKLITDLVLVFGGVAYYLITATVIGWIWYFVKKRGQSLAAMQK